MSQVPWVFNYIKNDMFSNTNTIVGMVSIVMVLRHFKFPWLFCAIFCIPETDLVQNIAGKKLRYFLKYNSL